MSGLNNGIALKSTGEPASGATIRVGPESSTGTPLSPLASIYSDSDLATALDNPFSADANGNFTFYAEPGFYKVQITVGTSVSTQTVQVAADMTSPVSLLNLNGIRFADQFSGLTPEDQLNNAISDAGSDNALVVIPPSVADSGDDISSLASNVSLIDYRPHYGSMLLWSNQAGRFGNGANGLRVQISPNLQRNYFPVVNVTSSVALDCYIDSWNNRDVATIGTGAGIFGINSTAVVAPGHDCRCEAGEFDVENYTAEVTAWSKAGAITNHKCGVLINKGDSTYQATGALRITAGRENQSADGKEGYGWFKGIDIAGVTGSGSVGIDMNTPAATSNNVSVFPDVGLRIRSSNSVVAAISQGAIIAGQMVDGSPILSLVRLTNTAPSGSFITMRDANAVGIATFDINGAYNGPAVAAFTSPAQSGFVRMASTSALNFRNNAGSADLNGVSKNSSDVVVLGDSAGVQITKVARYNAIATTGNGVPSEYATVDLTGQTAAIATTTLYAVPSTGAGQYRVSWNAKVTTAAGSSSTLGALTITYTDPDGVAQTITAGAQTSAGAIATTSTGNSTTTVLLGLPMLLNCKASTNIQYAMAYASNAANAMAYNLHIKVEAL